MRNLSLHKLLFILFIPAVLGLLTWGAISAGQSRQEYQHLARTRVLGALVNVVAQLTGIDSPAEGVTSIRFSEGGEDQVRGQLLAVRKAFDATVVKLRETASLADLADPEARADIAFILDRLAHMEAFRAKVDMRRISVAEVVDYLQPTAPHAFDLIKRVGSEAGSLEIARLADGFHALLQFIDGTHMENGAAFSALGAGKLSPADAESFVIGVRLQSIFTPTILESSPMSIRQAFSGLLDPQARQAFEQMRDLVRAIIAGQTRVALPNEPDWGRFMQAREVALGALIQRYEDELSTTTDRLVDTAWTSFVSYVGMTAGIVLFALIVGMGTARTVSRLLNRLSVAMTGLAGGDLQMSVDGAARTDAIGDMARAIEVFRRAAIENRRLEREAEDHRSQSDGDRARTERAQREAIELERAIVSSSIGAGLSRLAAKDLTYRITGEIPAAYRTLQDDFNAAMGQLEEAMQSISSGTTALHGGTREISAASSDLSRRTEQQAASLEETAASLDEITATVRKTAEGSRHARDVASQAWKAAELSGLVVRETVEAMSGIERSSSQIGQIIGVIDEIAFQTSLLALNAGVEAARAGDAGRGFAVVASEVRALAQRSAEAAKEIKALISASSRQVEQGVGLVGQTGEVLERIVVQIKDINGIVTEIASSAAEQAASLDQVNTAVNAMDRVTQENAAMVEQNNTASHLLAGRTEELFQVVARFETGRTHPAAAPPPAARPIRASAGGRLVEALKTVGRGGAARRPAPAAASEDWQEF